MNNITAVFLKQIKETFKNKTILIQFLLMPLLSVIMENTVKPEDMPEHFFVKLFSVMFIGMAPLTCMASIISEEKENNTLRALMMSNVKPSQYLFGIGLYVWLMCMAGSVIFALCGGWTGTGLCIFLAVMAGGIALSLLIGAIIGICCKNQMAATSVALPVTMIFSFLPMLSMFNETIEKFARIFYSQQLSLLINGLGTAEIQPQNIIVPVLNFIIALVIFFLAFRNEANRLG